MDQRLLDALRKFARNEIDLFATPFGLFEDEDLAASPTGPLILNPADPQTFQRLAVYLALHRLDVPVVSYDDAFMDDAAGYMAIDGAALSVGDEPIYDVDTAYAAALDAVEAKGRLVRGRRTLRPRLLLVRAIREEIADAEEIERFGRDAQRLLTSAPDTIGASSIELGRVAALLEAMQDAAADAGDSVAENGAGELPGLTQAVTPEIDLVFAFGGPWRETEQTRAAVDVLTADLKAAVPAAEVTIRIWGASELISAFERVSLAAVGVLKGAHLLSLPEIGPRFDGTKRAAAGWIGYAPATAVVGLIQGPDGMPDARLFYDNVRHYLGEDTLKNPGAAGLSRTLELGDGPEVVLRHNGITIVARAAEIDEQSGDVMLREYQIVNGAQTAFTLFTHRKRLGEAGQALAHVPIKIVVTEDESIKDGVVLGANTQSAVDRYDMLARRPEMRALQLAFEADAHWSPQKLWLQRRRAEPFRTRVAPIRVLTPRQLMEAFAAVILGAPHRVHDNAAQFLDDVPSRIFAPDHEPNIYMALGWMVVAGRLWAERHGVRWSDRWQAHGPAARGEGYPARHQFLFALFRLIDPDPDHMELTHSAKAAERFHRIVTLFSDRGAEALTDLAGVIVREAAGSSQLNADAARRLTMTEGIRGLTDDARERLHRRSA